MNYEITRYDNEVLIYGSMPLNEVINFLISLRDSGFTKIESSETYCTLKIVSS